tara:strand:- start:312 stop:2576 length:2265 start_codon:yes stop_codon:yes gene_type:complete
MKEQLFDRTKEVNKKNIVKQELLDGEVIAAARKVEADPTPKEGQRRIYRESNKDSRGLRPHGQRLTVSGQPFRLIYTYDNKYIYLHDIEYKPRIAKDEANIAFVNKSMEVPVESVPVIPNIDFELDIDEEVERSPIKRKESDGDEPSVTPNTISDLILLECEIPSEQWEYFYGLQSDDELSLPHPTPALEESAEILFDHLTTPATEPLSTIRMLELPDGAETLKQVLSGEISAEDLNILLSPEQMDAVNFAFDEAGPVLIRGGAGTGKSLIAQHRAKAYINHIGQPLFGPPKILFTTFTHGLRTISENSLEKILGDERGKVSCEVIDTVITRTYKESLNLIKPKGISKIINEKIRKKNLDKYHGKLCQECQGVIANIFQKSAEELNGDLTNEELDRLRKIGAYYLGQEIESIIYGHRLSSLREYFDFDRRGRKQRMGTDLRTLVWKLKEEVETRLSEMGKMTFAQLHAETSQILRNISQLNANLDWLKSLTTYDAIVVDEGQDLSPVTLSILTKLVPHPNRLFVVADSTQAIFRSGSTNIEGYENLNFRGRVRVLEQGFRTTEQISKAATDYFEFNGLKSESAVKAHRRIGPKPRLWNVTGSGDALLEKEATLIAAELTPSHTNRLNEVVILSSGTEQCKKIVESLKKENIDAVFLTSKSFAQAKKNRVSVMPLQSVKGLEFPIVYIAGLGHGFPRIPPQSTEEGINEIHDETRRLLYVGMTRAIILLTVCVPRPHSDLIFDGFNETLWNISDH